VKSDDPCEKEECGILLQAAISYARCTSVLHRASNTTQAAKRLDGADTPKFEQILDLDWSGGATSPVRSDMDLFRRRKAMQPQRANMSCYEAFGKGSFTGLGVSYLASMDSMARSQRSN
jgi:hypothetical protein